MINGLLLSDLGCHLDTTIGSCIAENRNRLVYGKSRKLTHDVNSTPEPGYSHFLFIDHDVSVKEAPKIVQAMIDENEPIIGLGYPMRGDPKRYCASLWPEGLCGPFQAASEASNVPVGTERGVLPVTWAGAGFLLVQREVFEALPYPWFRHSWLEQQDGDTVLSAQSPEDVGFCLHASQVGGFGTKLMVGCEVEHPTIDKKERKVPAGVLAELDAHTLKTLKELHNLEHSVHYYTSTIKEMLKRGIR